MKTPVRYLTLGWVVCSLLACSNNEQQELSAWMQQERDSIRPAVKAIPAPSTFQPHNYGGQQFVEPFSNEKLANILRSGQKVTSENSALIEGELNRRKQPLESFPLDSISMVGMLNQKGQVVALVKVDSLLYQVAVGGYLGQNYGRVVKVDENQILLREVVQDAAGEWTERTAALQLQEESTK